MPNPNALTPHEQRIKDREHLKMLGIFNFVLGGLHLFTALILVVYGAVLQAFFADPNAFLQNSPNGSKMTPQQLQQLQNMMSIVKWVMFMSGGCALLGVLLNVLGGLFLLKRTHRVFLLIVAGVNCVNIPFGTILGIFMILTLTRQSVRDDFEGIPVPSNKELYGE